MCTCRHACTYLCVNVCVHLRIHIHPQLHVYIYIYIYIYAHTHIHIHIHIHIHTYTYTHTYTHTYVCTTHTYTHILLQRPPLTAYLLQPQERTLRPNQRSTTYHLAHICTYDFACVYVSMFVCEHNVPSGVCMHVRLGMCV
jgi:hypothetical protein